MIKLFIFVISFKGRLPYLLSINAYEYLTRIMSIIIFDDFNRPLILHNLKLNKTYESHWIQIAISNQIFSEEEKKRIHNHVLTPVISIYLCLILHRIGIGNNSHNSLSVVSCICLRITLPVMHP